MKEKSVKERFIRKQLELAQERLEQFRVMFPNTDGTSFIDGKIEELEETIETLTHLLENCAE